MEDEVVVRNAVNPSVVPGTMEWVCEDDVCGKTFRRVLRHRGAMRRFCEACSSPKAMYLRKRRMVKSKQVQMIERGAKEIPLILNLLINNPTLKYKQIAEELGIPELRVGQYMRSNLALTELRRVASKEITAMIPKALKALNEIVDDKEHGDRFKAVSKVLESEKVLGSERIDVNVNIAKKSVEELRKLVEEAMALPKPTILEANLISSEEVPALDGPK